MRSICNATSCVSSGAFDGSGGGGGEPGVDIVAPSSVGSGMVLVIAPSLRAAWWSATTLLQLANLEMPERERSMMEEL